MISPNTAELFYLRMLLRHPSSIGSTSFVDVKNISGVPHATFRGACMSLGLLDDDSEWERAIEGAATSCMPWEIRQLFVALLTCCDIGSPQHLFDRFNYFIQVIFNNNINNNIKNILRFSMLIILT